MRGFSILETSVAIFLLAIFFLGNVNGLLNLSNLSNLQSKYLLLNTVYLNYRETSQCVENYICNDHGNRVEICSLLTSKCQNF